jgi:very-short-patch-repair endonuclease
MRRWGGVATRAQLVAATSRSDVDAALAAGEIRVLSRGRYALEATPADLLRAHALSGVLSYESAALHHGWPVLRAPDRVHVTVPLKRRMSFRDHPDVVLHRADLHPDDRSGPATSQARTLVDCMRSLSFPSALAVADSALRAGRSPTWLAALARDVRGRGAAQVRRVAAEATELAANPFESGLRGIACDVEGLHMRPQVPVFGGEFLGRPDLVDTDLRIIAEADSFEWHGGRSALVRDARRYNAFVVHGSLVLRFTWEDVVLEPASVGEVLTAVVAGRRKVRWGTDIGAWNGLSPV